MAMCDEPLAPQTLLPEMTPGTVLAIFGFRACAVGRAGCCTLRSAYQRALADDCPTALANMLTFVRMVGYHGRRRVRLSVPGCGRMTADEMLVAAIFAACQAKDYRLRNAHLTWLLAQPPSVSISGLVMEIADCFARNSLPIEAPAQPIHLKEPSPSALRVYQGGQA